MPEETISVRRGWVVVASMALGSLIMLGIFLWYYTRQRQAVEKTVSAQIAAIADVKATQIANWRGERLGDGRVQAASPTIQAARHILADTARPAERADVIAVLSQLEREFQYTGAFIADVNGGIHLQIPEDRSAPSRLADFARAAAAAKDVRLEDLYLDPGLRRPIMALTVPIGGVGAMILEIDPSNFLYPYLRGKTPGSSEETVLVRPEAGGEFTYLNDLRERAGTALVWKRRLPSWFSPRAFETPREMRATDYRGAPVLAAIRRVPDSPWYVFTKIDVAEVDAPLQRLGWELAILTALIGITNLAVVGLVWRSRELRIYHEREAWFRAVANETPAYLWMTYGEEQTSFINKPLARFLGSESDTFFTRWTDTLHSDDRERALETFVACLGARREYLTEFRILRCDGQYRWVISRGLPRFSPGGKFHGYAGSLTDITDTREAEQQLLATNRALANELADRTRHEQEIQSLTARLMSAQEEERKRLARELHDDLCQQIAALSIAVGNLKRNLPEERTDVQSQSGRIQQKLVETTETVRRISHRLHPAVLEYSGLVPALRAYCAEFSSLSGLKVAFDADESIRQVQPDTALNLYRITQEALQNVAKHAGVAEARVTLRHSEYLLLLTIEDHGIGLPTESAPRGGLGLVSIKERARLIQGTLEIYSKPNEGTVVTVKVPHLVGSRVVVADA